MATIKAIEAQILKIEGFRVRILHADGTDMRSDRMGIKGCPFARALKNSANVRDWKDSRFKRTYPGFRVDVLDADGRSVHGGYLLSTVRDTYLDD